MILTLDDNAPPWSRLELMLAPGPSIGSASAPLRLHGRHGRIELTDTALLSLLSGVQYPDDLPDALKVDLHRMALSRIPPALTRALGGPFHLLVPDQEKSKEESVLQCLLTLTEVNGDSHAFLLQASIDTLLRWSCQGDWRPHVSDAARHVLRQGPLRDLCFSGGLHLGRVTIPMKRLHNLRPGDAFLIPSKDGGTAAPIHILLGSELIKVSHREDDSYVFEGWVVEAPPLSNPSHVKAIEKVPSIMDALKVDLDFVVGQLSMTVAELVAASPGRILTLELATPPRVRIVAHGTELGSGELIDVNGRIAVEIVEWSKRS